MLPSHRRLLALIRDHPGLDRRSMAEVYGCSPETLHNMYSALRLSGYIEVERPPTRIRAYTYTVTDRGLSALEGC